MNKGSNGSRKAKTDGELRRKYALTDSQTIIKRGDGDAVLIKEDVVYGDRAFVDYAILDDGVYRLYDEERIALNEFRLYVNGVRYQKRLRAKKNPPPQDADA